MSEYGILNISSSKNLFSDYRNNYEQKAYIMGSVEKDNRDDINIAELNELLGLDPKG